MKRFIILFGIAISAALATVFLHTCQRNETTDAVEKTIEKKEYRLFHMRGDEVLYSRSDTNQDRILDIARTLTRTIQDSSEIVFIVNADNLEDFLYVGRHNSEKRPVSKDGLEDSQ